MIIRTKTIKLSEKRYNEIIEILADMFEDIGYKIFPIDVFELCRMLRITLVQYSSLPEECILNVKSLSSDGFNLLNPETNTYLIFYNAEMPLDRIRFTVMHEIGHIMLGHKIPSPVIEQEANFFAISALAPLGIIFKIEEKTPEQVSIICGISFECACNVLDKYHRTMIYPRILKKETESRLVRLLSHNIKEAA